MAWITLRWSPIEIGHGMGQVFCSHSGVSGRYIRCHCVFLTWSTWCRTARSRFSLPQNCQNLSELLPLHLGDLFAFTALTGQIVFSACFCGDNWSKGLVWNLDSGAYWGTVFPDGVFALLSVQLGTILDSSFAHYFGAIWSSESTLFPSTSTDSQKFINYRQVVTVDFRSTSMEHFDIHCTLLWCSGYRKIDDDISIARRLALFKFEVSQFMLN